MIGPPQRTCSGAKALDEIAHPLMSAHVPGFITARARPIRCWSSWGSSCWRSSSAWGSCTSRCTPCRSGCRTARHNKAQFEIVAVLALLALFTHNNYFWVAALLLAMIPIPDFCDAAGHDGRSRGCARWRGRERRRRPLPPDRSRPPPQAEEV